MTTEVTKEEVAMARAKLEYDRNRYMREKQRGVLQFRLKPATHNKLKGYYEEYIETCQRNMYLPVDFHNFVIEFCEIGYLNWKERNKGK